MAQKLYWTPKTEIKFTFNEMVVIAYSDIITQYVA